MDNDNHQETDYDALEQKEAVRKFVEDRVAKYIVSRNGREADQLPPAPVAEELSSEPVAWMHDKNGRVDVIHKDVKKLLGDWDATNQGTGEGYYRKLATVEHYTIPLYTHPQPAVPDVGALAEFIRDMDDGEYIPYHEFAQRICNWIEEQNNDQ